MSEEAFGVSPLKRHLFAACTRFEGLAELYLAGNRVEHRTELLSLRSLSRLIVLDASDMPLGSGPKHELYACYFLTTLKVSIFLKQTLP